MTRRKKPAEKRVGASGVTAEEIRASGDLLGITVKIRYRSCTVVSNLKTLDQLRGLLDQLEPAHGT